MAIVTDPDNLDRWQVLVDPVGETISIRGLGTETAAQSNNGASSSNTTFTATGELGSVLVGDILTIISGSDIGHYIVTDISGAPNSVTIDTALGNTESNLTYKVNTPAAIGGTTPNVADGPTMQAVYSFLKEEWKDLTAGLGNAPDLIAFTFPLESITREQFEIGGPTHSNWTFADETTRNLIRTAGWQVLDSTGAILADYTGVVTLGSLDSDAQVYYQQHATTADPTDFVLTGPVNQSVNTFQFTVTGTGNSLAVTGTNVIDRTTLGGSWITDGYIVGGLVTLRNSEDVANDGTYTITNVTATELTVSGTLTNNADDDSMEVAVNKRFYLKLFVRKKARTYAQSEIDDIGVTTIETIVNRFPLSHVTDAAISTRDGDLVGANPGTVFGTLVDVASTASGGGEGIADASTSDGVFEFTHTGGLFTSTNAVYPGDAIEFTSGSNQFQYEIESVTDTDNLVLFDEPGENVTAPDNAVSYTTRTRYIIAPGNTDGVNADATPDDGIGELTSATVGDWSASGVAAGDYIRITDGGTAGASLIGVYKVDSTYTTGATLLVDITDNENWTTGTGINFEVLELGMFLQQKSVTATQVIASTDNLTFADANPDTITRATGSFVTDGYVHGMAVTVAGTTSNDGTYIVDTVSATVLTLIASEALTAEGPLSGSQTINGEVGFVRTLNQVDYPFNWRLFGNGCTLNEAFEYIQRQLRRATDVDESSSSARGDVTDLLMSFATPTGTGLNLFIDDLDAGDLNNATFQDLTGDSRNFAFIAGVTITLNDNIISSSATKVVVFFTNSDAGTPGSDFGTVNAIIVNDADSNPMQATNPSTDLSFTYDYDNNVQRGPGSSNTTVPITIVAIGTDTAQYVQTSGTITRQNNNTFALVAALERNYSNPV